MKKGFVNTPPFLQMESVECGAAALGIICAYYGLHLPLEQLRIDCGVSRDGTNAKNMVNAASRYGFTAKGMRNDSRQVLELSYPFVIFWEYNHFLVVEGANQKKVFLNDPALGKWWVTHEEFRQAYSGVVLTFTPNSTFKKSGQPFNVFRKMLEMLSGSRLSLFFLLFTALLAILPAMIIPSLTRIFVDYVLINNNHSWMISILTSLAFAISSGAVILFIQQSVARKLNNKLSTVLSYKLMVRLCSLPMGFFMQRSKAEIAARFDFTTRIADSLTGTVLNLSFGFLSSVFFLIILLVYNLKLGLIVFLMALLTLRIFYWLNRNQGVMFNRFVKDSSSLSGLMYTGIHGIESIKSSSGELAFFQKWTGMHARYMRSAHHTQLKAATSRSVPLLLSAVNSAVILLIGGYEVMQGEFTVGMLISFFIFFQFFFTPLHKLSEASGEFQMLGSYFRSIADIINYPESKKIQLLSPSAITGNKLSGMVDIKELCFGYNLLVPPVIQNLSLFIPKGQRVAFIGLSGSGKSTLAKLITGLYEPWSGSVNFDGVPVQQLIPSIRTISVGIVDQEIELFEGTIRDVLTFWDRSVPLEDIIDACRLAEIHDVISRRPGGYYSFLTESGKNFSGGERQRMEIARALIHKPSILILDEATSALDPEIEFRICNNIKSLGITLIMVAHRLSTIKDADLIVVLDKGNIDSAGTHKSLIIQSALYREFLNITE